MVDPTKPVQTRDGRKARIALTDAKTLDPQRKWLVLVESPGSTVGEQAYFYKEGGYYDNKDTPYPQDLIQAPTPLPTRWINFYQQQNGGILTLTWPTRIQADTHNTFGDGTCIACIEVNGNVGDGLPA